MTQKILEIPPGKAPEVKKARGGKWRIASAIAPAAVITAGLFVTMHALVTVDEIDLAEKETRTLGKITPQETSDPAERQKRNPVQKIDTAAPPPPPARYVVGKGDIYLPEINIEGSAPDLGPVAIIDISLPDTITIDRGAVPVRRPMPSFPDRMAQKGISGSCEVSFDLTPRGLPFNVSAVCTDKGFEREAVRAVSRAEFAPKVRNGKAIEAHGLVYPLEFRLQ